MDRHLTATDREILARKERRRAKDRAALSSGAQTVEDVNRANAWATSVISEYRPGKKHGLKR